MWVGLSTLCLHPCQFRHGVELPFGLQPDRPGREPGEHELVVRGHDHGAAEVVQLSEELQDPGAGVAVDISGRLVGEQDPRLVGDRPRHRDALLLTTREVPGPLVQLVLEADQLQGVRRVTARVVDPRMTQLQRQQDVLEGGQMGKQLVVLEDAPHTPPNFRRLPAVQTVHGHAIHEDFSRLWAHHAEEHSEEGRLAHPRRPHEIYELAWFNFQVEPIEDRCPRVADGQILQTN